MSKLRMQRLSWFCFALVCGGMGLSWEVQGEAVTHSWYAGVGQHAKKTPSTVPSLDPSQQKIFMQSPEDPQAEELRGITKAIAGEHYLAGDEQHVHLFYEKVKGLGGAYMGVGSDQAYMFIGWMRPEIAWLVDYDLWVRYIHLVHQTFLRESETPEAFLRLWSEEDDERAVAILEKAHAENPQKDFIIKLFKHSKPKVSRRFQGLKEQFKEHSIPSFLSDQETYTFVRDMVRSGRVRPMLVNLLDDEGMKGIGEVSHALKIPVRVLYLSNAEQYWDYSDQFRENVRALLFDERSLIARTLGSEPLNGDYRYNFQPALNFKGWLSLDWVQRVYHIVERKPLSPGEAPLTFSDRDPEEANASRRERLQRRARRGDRKHGLGPNKRSTH